MTTFEANKFLTKSKLEEGAFYITKDGRILGYLGISSEGDLIFVNTIAVIMTDDWRACTVSIRNEDLYMPVLQTAVKSCIMNPDKLEQYSILPYKTVPQIYGKLDYLPTITNTVKFVYKANPNIIMATKAPTGEDLGYVSAKNLVVGKLYGGYRNWHIFLGRNDKKEFCWLYCGNIEALRQGIHELDQAISFSARHSSSDFQTTKSNKKTKVTEGFEDYCADLSKLSQESKRFLEMRFGLKFGSNSMGGTSFF